jgi:hypothetical protein
MFLNREIVLKEYGGYFYAVTATGSVQVQLPGTHQFFAMLPNYEVFTRFVDQANNVFTNATPGLALHLTGCKRCAKSLSSQFPDFFSPCKTGSEILNQGKAIAQEVSRIVANEFLQWWENEQQHRLSDHVDSNTAQDTA